VEDDPAGDERSYSVSTPGHPSGIARSIFEEAEALPDNLETQFQPVTDPSVPTVIVTVNVGLGSYFMAPASEPRLTKPEDVQEAIRCLRIGKSPGPKCIPIRALKHLQQRAVSHLF
jgi:hypothetical protein